MMFLQVYKWGRFCWTGPTNVSIFRQIPKENFIDREEVENGAETFDPGRFYKHGQAPSSAYSSSGEKWPLIDANGPGW